MTYTNETIFKVLQGNQSMHGGSSIWTLGEWQPAIKDIVPCKRGYHLCVGPLHLLEWLGPDLYVAEYRGEMVNERDKIVVSEARIIERVETWNDRTARLFAADCAERVLDLFEDQNPNDDRPRKAIETARRYANGDASADELIAARAAAWAAAWAAARDAEPEWQAGRLLAYLNGDVEQQAKREETASE